MWKVCLPSILSLVLETMPLFCVKEPPFLSQSMVSSEGQSPPWLQEWAHDPSLVVSVVTPLHIVFCSKVVMWSRGFDQWYQERGIFVLALLNPDALQKHISSRRKWSFKRWRSLLIPLECLLPWVPDAGAPCTSQFPGPVFFLFKSH